MIKYHSMKVMCTYCKWSNWLNLHPTTNKDEPCPISQYPGGGIGLTCDQKCSVCGTSGLGIINENLHQIYGAQQYLNKL